MLPKPSESITVNKVKPSESIIAYKVKYVKHSESNGDDKNKT